MNYPTALHSGIFAPRKQATGYQTNVRRKRAKRPKSRGMKPLSTFGGLVRRRVKFAKSADSKRVSQEFLSCEICVWLELRT
jgi:hypothetical protein